MQAGVRFVKERKFAGRVLSSLPLHPVIAGIFKPGFSVSRQPLGAEEFEFRVPE